MMSETKTVRVKRDTWRDLYAEKGPGDTFDDVISELIERCADEEPTEQAAD